MIWCDTRQQAGKHANIDGWFDAHGVAYEYRKLDFGDYMCDESNISVDTKQGVEELAGNLGRDHARFVRECERAQAAGYRLVVLTEEPLEDARLELARWLPFACKRCVKRAMAECEPRGGGGCAKGKRKPMQGATMLKIMSTLSERYGVRFQFCGRNDTACIICDLLGVSYENGKPTDAAPPRGA